MRIRLRHTHHSSRYSRTGLSLYRAVMFFLKKWNNDLITFTEVGNNKRVKRLRFIPNFKWVQIGDGKGQDECGALLNLLRWKLEWKESLLLDREGLATRGGLFNYALVFLITHRRTLKQVLVVVWHGPAGIEEPKGFDYSAPRTKHFFRCTSKMHTYLTNFHKKHPKVEIMWTGDFNLDIEKEWVQNWEVNNFPHFLDSSWMQRKRGFPKGGTHYDRIIDDTWSTMKLIYMDLLEDISTRAERRVFDPASDHDEFREVFSL